MKRFNMVITFIVAIGLFISTPLKCLAAENENHVISYETYSKTLIEKYAEYGHVIEMKPIDENFVYTQELLDEELENATDYCLADENQYYFGEDSETIIEGQEKSPRSMVANVSASTQKYVIVDNSNPLLLCSATIQTTGTITTDLQTNHIISAARPSLKVISGTGVTDYIELNSYSVSIDNSSANTTKHNVTYNITCTVRKSITIGAVESWENKVIYYSTTMYPCK